MARDRTDNWVADRPVSRSRGVFGWLCVSLFWIWQVLLIPRLAVAWEGLDDQIRSALYPVAEIATATAGTLGVVMIAFIWLAGTFGLGTVVLLTRGRPRASKARPRNTR